MTKKKRPRTNRVCIAFVGEQLEREYQERLSKIKQIQRELNIKFKEARDVHNH